VHKNISIEAVQSRVPLMRTVSVIADVFPMRMPCSGPVVGIDHYSFAMRTKHCFQLSRVLLFAGQLNINVCIFITLGVPEG
jgi:hypothetical protein